MKRQDSTDREVSSRLESIRMKYGELLNLEDIADFYKYNSVGAVRKAFSRGTLPVCLYKFKTRRGYYAKADEVAESIESMEVLSQR